jgi:hypothetical protein
MLSWGGAQLKKSTWTTLPFLTLSRHANEPNGKQIIMQAFHTYFTQLHDGIWETIQVDGQTTTMDLYDIPIMES